MRSLIALLAVLSVATPPSVSLGQKTSELTPSDKVRVYRRDLPRAAWGRRGPHTSGTVVAFTTDSLAIATDEGATVTLPVGSIAAIEVRKGTRSNWLKGMAAGAVIGAGAGLAFGLAGNFETEGCYTGFALEPTTACQDTWISVLGTTGIGAAGGALLGAIIGAAIKTDRWEEVSIEGQPVRLIAGSSRIGFAATISF